MMTVQKHDVCKVVASVSQHVGSVSIVLYVVIFAMLAAARDPSLAFPALVVVPIAMLLVRIPAVINVVRANMSTRNMLVILWSLASNEVLRNVYVTRPLVAMCICVLNVCLLAWYAVKTDKYSRDRLLEVCDADFTLQIK
jgi:Na+/phosphate symporter